LLLQVIHEEASQLTTKLHNITIKVPGLKILWLSEILLHHTIFLGILWLSHLTLILFFLQHQHK